MGDFTDNSYVFLSEQFSISDDLFSKRERRKLGKLQTGSSKRNPDNR